mmetsp:Transcript_15349/g.31136  ORF Transcript_15349/g.31136 Transcript_15349/m.31136 type:complete len:93 (+) Transcript_15349:874-1152(+)
MHRNLTFDFRTNSDFLFCLRSSRLNQPFCFENSSPPNFFSTSRFFLFCRVRAPNQRRSQGGKKAGGLVICHSNARTEMNELSDTDMQAFREK